MNDTNLPPPTDGRTDISERLQEYNKKIQEQAFLLGYRNGFREGELAGGLLEWLHAEQADPDISQERLDALRDVEHWLSSHGAFQDEDGEITHPPGLLFYIGANMATPFVEVAGERIHFEDFDLEWDPAPSDTAGRYDGFEPQAEAGKITIEATVELPEDGEARAELMQYLEGIR